MAVVFQILLVLVADPPCHYVFVIFTILMMYSAGVVVMVAMRGGGGVSVSSCNLVWRDLVFLWCTGVRGALLIWS